MTISEQIEKLDRIPGCDWTGKEIEYALSIIRAITAPPTETEIEAVAEAIYMYSKANIGANLVIEVEPKERWYGHAKAAISAFLKGRGM